MNGLMNLNNHCKIKRKKLAQCPLSCVGVTFAPPTHGLVFLRNWPCACLSGGGIINEISERKHSQRPIYISTGGLCLACRGQQAGAQRCLDDIIVTELDNAAHWVNPSTGSRTNKTKTLWTHSWQTPQEEMIYTMVNPSLFADTVLQSFWAVCKQATFSLCCSLISASMAEQHTHTHTALTISCPTLLNSLTFITPRDKQSDSVGDQYSITHRWYCSLSQH